MARYTTSGTKTTIASLNTELEKIQQSISELLSRNGETPNQMLSTLDMNSKRILNVPDPVFETDVVRLKDLETFEGATIEAGVSEEYVAEQIAKATDPFDPKELQVIAHRGFRNVEVQNTLLAFSKCAKLGAEVLEIDLQVTSDGVVVCFHDNTVDALTNGTGTISSLTFAQVQALQLNELTGTELQSTLSIPSFDEALSLAERSGLLLSVEMKRYRTQADIRLMIDRIAAFGYLEKTVISSFNYSDSLYARAYNPTIRVGYIGGGSNPVTYQPLFDQMAADGIEFLIWSSASFLGDSQVAEYARSKGLKIQAYTIVDVEDVEVCLRKGVFAVISDVPIRGY